MFAPIKTGESARYWDVGDKLIANNSRVASVSLFRAISSLGLETKGVIEPTKPVYLLVREPVSRFISAKSKGHIYAGTGNHFELQSKLAVGPKVFLYRFPEHLSQFAIDTGLNSIPWVNASISKSSLSAQELSQAMVDYHDDFVMFNAIKHPGFEWKLMIRLFLLLSCLSAFAQLPVIPLQTLSSGGNTLLNGLQVAWNFDDQFAGPTNRFSDFGSQILTNVGALTGTERSLSSGGVIITNSGAGYLNLTNTSMFGLNSSFTAAFWVCGGVGGSAACSIGQHVTDSVYDWRWDGTVFKTLDAGSSGHQVVGSSISATTWLLTVCGYDAANNQIFISNNGGAKTTAASGGSVKQTANMPFRITINPDVIDNFYFWNRVLTTAEITQLYNSGRAMQYPFVNSPGMQTATAWAWAITNLGGTVSANSITAVGALCDAFVTAGIMTRATCIIPFAPDSLQAALTSPVNAWDINGGNNFIAATILPYEGNQGFVTGDLSVNGLTGNGSSKYVQLFPGAISGGLRKIMPNPLDAGKILYSYTTNRGAYVEEGYIDSGATPNNFSDITVNFNSGNAVQGYIGGVAGGAVTNATVGYGFYSVQRVNNTEIDGYFANSTTPHFLFNQNTTASGVSSWRVNFVNYAVFTYWDAVGAGPVANYSSNTLSFLCYFNAHLTSSESSAAYNAIQSYLTTKGGGFR